MNDMVRVKNNQEIAADNLIMALDPRYPRPEIVKDCIPDDDWLDMEWYIDKRNLLSVMIGKDGCIYWASFIQGVAGPRGSCLFCHDLADQLNHALSLLYV